MELGLYMSVTLRGRNDQKPVPLNERKVFHSELPEALSGAAVEPGSSCPTPWVRDEISKRR